MIDIRTKREELINSVNTCQETISKTRDHINFLNGAITLLNELIAEEDKDAASSQTISVEAHKLGQTYEDHPQNP